MKKIKVIHLISTDVFSGAENVACQIINCFKNESRYEMIYVSKIASNQAILEERKIQYYKLKKFSYIEIRKAIKAINPDIIHAHDAKASIIASLFSNKAKIISHIHGNHENMRNASPKALLFKLASGGFHRIIWVCKSALDDYKFKNDVKNKSIILYNVINPNEIKDKIQKDQNKYDKFDLIYLGRLVDLKNPLRFLGIVNVLVKENPKIKAAIVGDGELMDQVLDYIKKNTLSDNIKVFGFINNPYKILSSSKVLMMTSRYEGTPMCALEALALGKPIITTPTDGLMDIVDNGSTGYISNDDNELAQKAMNLLTDNNTYEKMRKAVINKSKKINNINAYRKSIDLAYE